MSKTYKPLTRLVVEDGADFLPPELKKWAPVANEIQHLILTRLAMGLGIARHTHRFEDGSWRTESHPEHVALMWDHLTDLMGTQQVGAVLPWMLANGYLERTSHYDPDVHAYGYAIGPVLRGRPRKRIKTSDPRFLKRVAEFHRANMRNWGKAHRHRRNWAKKVDVNLSAMRDVIAKLPDEQKRNAVDTVVDLIEMGDLRSKVCDFDRHHDVFTCLLSDLRRFLSFGGRTLVNLDIANSQPFILGSLILSSVGSAGSSGRGSVGRVHAGVDLTSISRRMGDGWGRPPEEEDEAPSTKRPQNEEQNGHNHLVLPAHTSQRIRPESVDAPDDLLAYIKLCQEGTLYEYLMGKTGYTDKKQFKDEVWFHFLYGSNKERAKCVGNPDLVKLVPLIDLFTSEFPTVYEYMWRAKTRNYKLLPCKMQRLESRIMIDTVVGWLAEHRPEVPLLTIHDSLLTVPEHAALVKRLIEVSFEAHGFMRPALHVEAA